MIEWSGPSSKPWASLDPKAAHAVRHARHSGLQEPDCRLHTLWDGRYRGGSLSAFSHI